jgi:predicted phosphohydrolase
MKIQFASDLHLEFSENNRFLKQNPLIPSGDILILAGDIVLFRLMEQFMDFFKFCSDNFEKTYWIPGNHEYYNGDLADRTGTFMEEIVPNVHLVNNTSIDTGNTRIIFSTLWTPITDEKAWHIQNGLNDYRLIKDNGSLFTPVRSTELFNENLAFIQKSVSSNQQEKCVVVTHHVPTFTDYPKEYRSSNLNEAFATDLNKYIESSAIDYWIYGHHHRNIPTFKIGNTELLTNQLGYVNQNEHLNFNGSKFIKTI